VIKLQRRRQPRLLQGRFTQSYVCTAHQISSYTFVMYLVKTGDNFYGTQYWYSVKHEITPPESPIVTSHNYQVTLTAIRKNADHNLSKQMFEVLPISFHTGVQISTALVDCLVSQTRSTTVSREWCAGAGTSVTRPTLPAAYQMSVRSVEWHQCGASVQLSKPSDATYSARPVGQPSCGHRLPQPG